MLRIRGRTLRDESLETNTARDLEQVVRMFVEMDVGPVSPSSTTWYEKKRSGLNHWTDMTQGTWNKSCGHIRKWTSVLWARVQLHRMWGRKTEAKNEFTVWSHSAFLEFQIIHTVNDFSQSLLDFLESRVMKRKSINHCEERSGIKPSQCEVFQSCEPEFNYTE